LTKEARNLSSKTDDLLARIEQLELSVTELAAQRQADQFMINLAFGAIEYLDPDIHEACLAHLERFAEHYPGKSMQLTRQQNAELTDLERDAFEVEFEMTQLSLLDYLESQRFDDPDGPSFSVIEGGRKD
jgi:DNA-binding transcriptional LysR family regulator